MQLDKNKVYVQHRVRDSYLVFYYNKYWRVEYHYEDCSMRGDVITQSQVNYLLRRYEDYELEVHDRDVYFVTRELIS